MSIQVGLVVDPANDEGLYKFIETFLSISGDAKSIHLVVRMTFTSAKPDPELLVQCNGQGIETYKGQEILKKVRTSGAVLFYNSTQPDPRFLFTRRFGRFFEEVSTTDRKRLQQDQTRLNNTVSALAKKHQKDITELVGRLEEKYEVGLSVERLNLDYLDFDVTLGDKGVTVPLYEWGSGTRNRTIILLTLLKARRMSQTGEVVSKITPVIVIEEPESFLHPSAQAEFGRVLQDLAEEFSVQVLATTHSPYMLNLAKPESNVLLTRRQERKQLRGTERVKVTGDNWMEPFGLALGIANVEFEPWKKLFFSRADSILLVEGDIDKEYFELLTRPEHGKNRLKFEGEIFAYGGKDTLKNNVLLRFIKNRYEVPPKFRLPWVT